MGFNFLDRSYRVFSDVFGTSKTERVGGAVLLGNEKGVIVKGNGVSTVRQVSHAIAEAASNVLHEPSEEIKRILTECSLR